MFYRFILIYIPGRLRAETEMKFKVGGKVWAQKTTGKDIGMLLVIIDTLASLFLLEKEKF